jgi:hypothetical protein
MLELQGIDVIELFTEPDMRRELIEDLRRNGFVKDKILYLRRRDTTPITVTVRQLQSSMRRGRSYLLMALCKIFLNPRRLPALPLAR